MLDRKEYRKKYNAAGLLYIGGETLRLNCFDVSVKGAMVEIMPGILLATVEDFKDLLLEDSSAEIFIEDLMMTGEVVVAWAKESRNRIMLGVEFSNVIPKATKLWRKRRNFRKRQPFSAEIIIDKDKLNVEGLNCSMEGLCFRMAVEHPALKIDALVKLHIKEFNFNALGKVIWVHKYDDESVSAGLQIITIKPY